MQIIQSNQTNQSPTHFIETPHNIVLNGQIYDKITMQPKEYKFYRPNFTKNIYAEQLDTVSIANNALGQVWEPGYKPFIQDNTDSNICYIVDYSAIKKLKKDNDNNYSMMLSISPQGITPYAAYVNHHHYKILGQNRNYLIVSAHGMGNSTVTGQMRGKGLELLRIKKSDMSFVHGFGGACIDGEMFVFENTENYLYMIVNWSGNLYLRKYNIEANTYNDIYTYTVDSYADSPGITNVIEFNNEHYILTSNIESKCYQLIELNINYETDEVTTKSYNLPVHNLFPYHTGKETDSGGWLIYSLKNIDDKYIAITTHDNRNSPIHQNNVTQYPQDYFSSKGWHRHVIYKFENNKFTLVDAINFGNDTIRFYGVLYYDQYTVCFYSTDAIMFYKFNPTRGMYEKGHEIAGVYNYIGFDEMKRFYYESGNNINCISNITACILDAKFENEDYVYDDSDINTNIIITAKNFMNENIVTQVKLTVTGNCKFVNNNSNVLTYTTGGLNKCPVVITGPGQIDIVIEQE